MSRRTGVKLGVLLAALLGLALIAMPGAAAAKAKDRNGDKIPDRWEKRHRLSLKVNQARKDQDQDGLRNRSEFQAGTDPRNADSDGDGVGDGDENGDKDGVDNQNEEVEHTNPGDKDTDNDGTPDGKEDTEGDGLNNHGEDQTGNDPVDPDTDDDGIEDGEENAGVVADFNADTHVLRIELFGGGDVVGLVTEQTKVSCENEDEHEGDNNDDGEHHDGEQGDGEDQPGDGHTGDAAVRSEEPGDGEPSDGEDEGEDDGDGEHDGHACSLGDLTSGTPVHEAEMKLTGDGLIFTKIELVR